MSIQFPQHEGIKCYALFSAGHGDKVFWMVEMMEVWFHPDSSVLAELYGAKGDYFDNKNCDCLFRAILTHLH